MKSRLGKYIVLIITAILLMSCSDNIEKILFDDHEENINQTNLLNSEQVTLIEDLADIEYFRSGALEHILEGELNRNDQAVGYHYDRLPTKKGKIIEGTETKPNLYGVYEAEVEVEGILKTSNQGKSSFFPKDWDTQEVIDAINEVYETREHITGNTFGGFTTEGIYIQMYLDDEDRIISAFPVYEEEGR